MDETLQKSREFYQEYFAEETKISYDNKQRYRIVFSLINQCGLDKNSRVLDVGAGSGRITEFLDNNFENNIALDITIAPLLGEKASETGVCCVEGALPKLPFFADSFDLVVCSEVIEHIPNQSMQSLAIEELARVLAPGGWLVLSTPNPRSPHPRIKSLILNAAEITGSYERTGGQLIENWISPAQLQEMIESHFVLEKKKGSYYNLPGFGTGLQKIFRPLSDIITKKEMAPKYGLYQYYIAYKPT